MINIWTRKAKNKSTIEISLTPLIDTALTLVIILMITIPNIGNILNIKKISKDKINNNLIEIKIDKNKNIIMDNQNIEFTNIETVLKSKVIKNKNITLKIIANKNVNYNDFFNVYNAAIKSGIKRVSFSRT